MGPLRRRSAPDRRGLQRPRRRLRRADRRGELGRVRLVLPRHGRGRLRPVPGAEQVLLRSHRVLPRPAGRRLQ